MPRGTIAGSMSNVRLWEKSVFSRRMSGLIYVRLAWRSVRRISLMIRNGFFSVKANVLKDKGSLF